MKNPKSTTDTATLISSQKLDRNTPDSISRKRLRQVTKRDGRVVDWDRSRISRALRLAYENTLTDGPALNAESLNDKVDRLSEGVEWAVWHRFPGEDSIPIESIQDVAETCIAAAGDWDVARAYVRYRTQRAERRPKQHGDCGLQEYIAVSSVVRHK